MTLTFGCQGHASTRLKSSSKSADDVTTLRCDLGRRAATTRPSINAQRKLQEQIGGHVIIIQDATTAHFVTPVLFDFIFRNNLND